MHTKFIIGGIAAFGSIMLAFETTGVEVAIPLPDGGTLRVGGKLGALIAEGASGYRSKQYDRAISSFTAALRIPTRTSPSSFTSTVPLLIPTKDNRIRL